MDIIRFSIHNPVTVVVGVILVVMFGLVSLVQLPIQLSPNVQEPLISVTTVWPGATPYEVERDIVDEQEEFLKGIPGLYEMESTASNGQAQITLRFRIGTDIDNALLRVSNKLDEVPSYPENVDRPVINASGAESSPVVWIVLRTAPENERHVYTYLTHFENNVRQYLDRIDGVSDLFIGGGVETEMHVVVDTQELAAHDLTVDYVSNALRRGNANVSAGIQEVGRREFRIRSVAEYREAAEIEDVVLVSDGEREVRVSDVAEVMTGYERFSTPMISDNEKGIAIGVRPEPDANILELTDRIEAEVIRLNKELLRGQGLFLEIVNEKRPYIRGAIQLLQQNIAIGGAMAIVVLLLFLRSLAPTIVVSTAIPISIIGAFIFMRGMGSTLNVVSLAGIAFAVGMLVDNAIVVLENIDRHRRMGKSPFKAAYDGTREVWGAVLASSATTVAVFLPVVFLEQEAGQLFQDIAIAVASAVTLSLIISMTLIPSFSRQLFALGRTKALDPAGEGASEEGPGAVARVGHGISALFMSVLRGVLANAGTRILTIVLLAGGAVFVAYQLMPKMEYLPQGNRDLIINIMIPPPGLSFEERTNIGEDLFAFFDPYTGQSKDGYPPIKRMFYVGRGGSLILGVISENQMRTPELLPLCQKAMSQIPGVYGISNQASIFEQGLGQGRTISVDFSGADINALVAAAGAMFGMVQEEIPQTQVRPEPSLDLLFPEVNYIPDRRTLEANGMTAEQFGFAVDVLMDGRDIGDFKPEGKKKIELILKASEKDLNTPQDVYEALVVTGGGEAVPVSSLARMEETRGLSQVRHLERNRTISLQVTPPYTVTLEDAMQTIEETILPRLEEQGLMQGIRFGMSGTADKLTETRQSLQWNFALAAAISYLLMSALLGNFIYPFIIMFTVPLAGAGGLIGLKLVNLFIAPQQLDILTMLGFIILIGVVVNNAILIVYQALQNIRTGGMEHKDAVLESARTRLRPIYMSATTSIFGMLPLVLWPGPGSELYRGLGSVVLGGLAVSTIFTMILIPALLMFFIRMETPGKERGQEE